MKFITSILFLFACTLGLFSLLLLLGESGQFFDPEIFFHIRLPKVVTCVFAGGLLSIAGLLMQSYFQNPLAGPDILGISSGSTLFVAIFMMAQSLVPTQLLKLGVHFSSFLGSLFIFNLLVLFIHKQKGKVTILIIGILISSFVSSIVSVLVNTSQALQLKSYLLWSQGSFRNTTYEDLGIIFSLLIISIIPLVFLKKSFDQLALGENYAKSMGVSVTNIKRIFIFVAAFIVSVITVYCGPISFIGIIAPFIAKKFIKKSGMNLLLPASFLIGSFIALFSELLITLIPQLPLTTNSTLGIIGAPILVYFVYTQREIV